MLFQYIVVDSTLKLETAVPTMKGQFHPKD